MRSSPITPWLSFLFAAAALLVAAPAAATENLPGAIAQHLSLPSAPPCSLCHVGGNTGAGTPTTPFARSARDRGLVAENVEILNAVLDQLKSERVDSDADGVTDIDELVAGTDPNRPPNDAVADQRYGCFARIAAGTGSSAPPAFALLTLATLVWARRRGASRRP